MMSFSPLLILVALVVLGVTNAGSFFYGQHVEAAEAAQAQLETERLAAAALKLKRDKVAALDSALAKSNTVRAGRDRIIIQEVIRYEQATPAADRCTLPGAWRLRHDAAASGEPADPARLVAGGADPVTDAAALATVADNYIDCRGAIEQVKGWQAWWMAVQ